MQSTKTKRALAAENTCQVIITHLLAVTAVTKQSCHINLCLGGRNGAQPLLHDIARLYGSRVTAAPHLPTLFALDGMVQCKNVVPPSPLRFSFYKRLAPRLVHTPCPPPHQTSPGSSMQREHHSSTSTPQSIKSTLSSSMRSAQPPLLPTPSATLGAFLPTLLPGSNQTSPLVGSGCTRVYTCVYTCMEQILPSHLEVKCARARSLGRYSCKPLSSVSCIMQLPQPSSKSSGSKGKGQGEGRWRMRSTLFVFSGWPMTLVLLQLMLMAL